MIFPEYERLRRYRPDRRFGSHDAGLTVCWSPDHFPWPQVSAYRTGDSLEVGAQIGALGPDPALAFYLSIPRPGRRRR